MSKPIFLHYPKCDTCRKAAKWIAQHHIDTESRDIVTQHPTAEELTVWIKRSGLPVSKFFNTSGLKYKAMGLKDVVKFKPENELIELLASDGMLVKRPLLISEQGVMVGFKNETWSEFFGVV